MKEAQNIEVSSYNIQTTLLFYKMHFRAQVASAATSIHITAYITSTINLEGNI
jgi:hypothetical protein